MNMGNTGDGRLPTRLRQYEHEMFVGWVELQEGCDVQLLVDLGVKPGKYCEQTRRWVNCYAPQYVVNRLSELGIEDTNYAYLQLNGRDREEYFQRKQEERAIAPKIKDWQFEEL